MNVIVALVLARQKLKVAEARCAAATNDARLRRERLLARVSMLKLLCDLTQALPSALALESAPELLDHLAGLGSAALSLLKLWIAHKPHSA